MGERRIYKYQGILIGDNRVNSMYSKASIDKLLEGKISLVDGKIPADEIPSYLNVYDAKLDFPTSGSSEFIYADASTNSMYRYDEKTATYEISEDIILNGGGKRLDYGYENIKHTYSIKI